MPMAGRIAGIIDIPKHYPGFGASRLAPGPAGTPGSLIFLSIIKVSEPPGLPRGRPDLRNLGIPYGLLGILRPCGRIAGIMEFPMAGRISETLVFHTVY